MLDPFAAVIPKQIRSDSQAFCRGVGCWPGGHEGPSKGALCKLSRFLKGLHPVRPGVRLDGPYESLLSSLPHRRGIWHSVSGGVKAWEILFQVALPLCGGSPVGIPSVLA